MPIKRRSFLKSSAASMAGMAILPSPGFLWPEANTGNDFSTLLSKLIPINDDRINQLWQYKIDDPTLKWHGGYVNQYDIPNAHSTSGFVVRGCIAYCAPSSTYHRSEKLKADIEAALDCLLNVQHEDGTIDLYSTNFHSTPDTAFIVNDLVPTYKMLQDIDGGESLKDLLNKMKSFILRAGESFLMGGIHTANHRWVVSAALARLWSIEPRQEYIDRMDQWLAEGIDQDSDGQFHERSVSIYSPICDNMFLAMAKIHHRDHLLEVVRKNLEMTLFYIQPGGEVLTEASDRQDKSVIGNVSRYYLSYRYFAIADHNGQFSGVCRLIEDKMLASIVGYIPYMYEFAEYQKDLPSPAPLPSGYFKYFKDSGVIRINEGNMDLSIIEKNPTFLVLIKGNVVLQSIRLAAAFFGVKGQFIPEEISVEGQKIILKKSITHGYYQPIPEDKTTGVNGWKEYPREDRVMSELQTMNYTVVITPESERIRMDIEISGTDDVPVSCEMSFRVGDALSGTISDLESDGCYFLEEGYAQIQNQGDDLKFGPGKMEHRWAQMRGMLPRQEGESVYITGMTPFVHTLYFW